MVTPIEIWKGRHIPSAPPTRDRARTSRSSEAAELIELCLFDADGSESRIALPEVDAFIWHGFVPSVEPGQLYGFPGYMDPTIPATASGVIPKAVDRPLREGAISAFSWDQCVFGYNFGDPDSRNDEDSANHAEVGGDQPFFDWDNDRPPGHEYADSVIYEAHVKG